MSADITAHKAACRREAARRLLAIEPSRLAAQDEAIAARLYSLPQYRAAASVFCYVSVGREAATRAIIARALAAGKRVAVPLIEGAGLMSARLIGGLDELREGAYGIPAPDKNAPLLLPQAVELAIIPCLACEPSGARLGHGGGYYDRYLAACPAYRVALCHSDCLFEHLPRAAHDILMDMVLYDDIKQ